jgi:hypothetical protein
VKLVRLRRPEVPCSSSYADYRPETNAAIYETPVTLKGTMHGRDREREGNQKLECGSCAY